MPFAGSRARRWSLIGIAGCAFLAARPAASETYTGPSKCVGCHDHDRQAQKWQKEEPALLKAKAHFNTLKQLDAPKSAAFAKAIGLADPYDVKGSCVKCHGTVFRGDANAGVSCESCHGPASGYTDLHQQKGSYLKAVAAGLRDLREKPAAIARTCVECHVVPDKRLAAAGHPAGEAFDAGASLPKIAHWNTRYDYGQVTAAGRAAAGGRAAGPPPAVSAPTGGATPARPAPAPRPAAAAAAPAPWDWDQPIRPLPDTYVPEPVPAASAAPASAPRPAPAIPPSIAEDTPVPQPPAPAVLAPAAPAAPAGPRPPAAQVAELRGRAAGVLERMLRAGARTPGAPAPARPTEFKGPDSELLRLQDEVLALALEALRRPGP